MEPLFIDENDEVVLVTDDPADMTPVEAWAEKDFEDVDVGDVFYWDSSQYTILDGQPRPGNPVLKMVKVYGFDPIGEVEPQGLRLPINGEQARFLRFDYDMTVWVKVVEDES